MSKNLEIKKTIVDDIASKLDKAVSVVFVDYRGINVADVSALRNEMRAKGCEYHVYKNNLMKLALDKLNIHDFDDKLEGTLAVAFSFDNEVDAAKILNDAAKKTSLVIKFGLVDKKYADDAEIKALANLPTKEVLIAKLMGMLRAPAQQLCTVLSGPTRAMTIALNAIATKQN